MTTTTGKQEVSKKMVCGFSVNICTNMGHNSRQDMKTELKKQFTYAWPTILFYLMNWLLNTVSLIFCGRLGKAEFAAASLAISMLNCFGVAIGLGLTAACDTFFSQLYGSTNKKHLGVMLQRSLLIINMFALPVLGLLFNVEQILLFLSIDSQLARLAGGYISNVMPAVPAIFSIDVLVKYLQNTNHVLPIVAMVFITNLLNVLLCYISIYNLNMSLRGPALALVLSNYFLLAFLITYIIVAKVYVDTWDGWSWDCLYDWGSFISLAFSGMMHTCLEWWGLEIGYFLTGLLGKTELGAFSISLQLANIAYMVAFGISVAVSIRIGHSLGSKRPNDARVAFVVAIVCGWVVALMIDVLWMALRDQIAMVFISDPEIIALVSKLIPMCVIYEFFDFTAAICNGGLRGSGHQKIGAITNFISFYLFCLPIGASLMFCTDLGVLGLWIGITTGFIVQGTTLFIILSNLDWDKEVHLAQIRTGTINEQAEHIIMSDDAENGTTLKYRNHTDNLDSQENDSQLKQPLKGEEKEMEETDMEETVVISRPSFKHVICKRLSLLFLCVGIFLVGLLLRIISKHLYLNDKKSMTTSYNLNISTVASQTVSIDSLYTISQGIDWTTDV